VNGLSLSKLRSFGATFFIFSEHTRPAIRLAALMELPVFYVLTHDEMGDGEDGPTHQPVEHLASLRAIPGLVTLRPAYANEVVEAYRYILQLRHKPAEEIRVRTEPDCNRPQRAVGNLSIREKPHEGRTGCSIAAIVIHRGDGPRERGQKPGTRNLRLLAFRVDLMKMLKDVLLQAESDRVAVGHFNFSDLVAFNAIAATARALNLPVMVGVSEGERAFVGVRQAAALVRAAREEYGQPIFINADHTHSMAKAEEAARAGFDEIIF
jgi:hypothetical protein